MELLRPKKVPRPYLSVALSATSSFQYTDPVLNVTMTKSINVVSMNHPGMNHVPMPGSPSDEQMSTYGAMQALIKSCVDNAEEIKNRLHQIMMNKAVPSSEEERRELMKMDFMKLKQWFMDDVRNSKIYKNFSQYNSTGKLKPFSKAFNDFILDRNKYTHGELSFLSPEFRFVLEYIDGESQHKEYAYIDIDILKSYNSCYIEIAKVISEYSRATQQMK